MNAASSRPVPSPPPPGADPTEGDRRWVGRLIVGLIVGPALAAALSILARWIW